MKMQWPKHLFYLDITRGIASLGVVLWHWQHFAYVGDTLSENFSRENQPYYSFLKIFYEYGAMGVEYFFLLSGFIFYWLYKDLIQNRIVSAWKYTVQRFARLYPLHFVSLVLVAILQQIYIMREGEYFVYRFNDIYHFILNLGFVSHWGLQKGFSFNGPIWSVSIEILLYMIFFILIVFKKGNWLTALTISLVSFAIYHTVHYPIFRGLSMFFLGGFVYYLTVAISTRHYYAKNAVYFITIFSWTLLIVNFYYYDLAGGVLEYGAVGKAIIVFFPAYILFPATVISLVLVEIEKGAKLKSFAWIGDITYSTYLLHFPLQLLFILFVSYGILKPEFYLYKVNLVIFFIILILISYFIFLTFEKPAQTFLRKKLLNANSKNKYNFFKEKLKQG